MALLNTAFNANDVEPSEKRDFSAMPPDKYTMCIVNSDMRAIKAKPGHDPNGNYGQYLWLEIEVMEGQYERRKLFENLVLEHENPQTVQIAQQKLRDICLACRKPNISDSEELHGIPFIADVVVEQDRRNKNVPQGQPLFPPVNRIKTYSAVGDQAAPQRERASSVGSPPDGARGGAGGFASTGGPAALGGGGTANTPSGGTAGGGGASGGSGLPWGKGR